jgi:hypothetical protein
MAELTVTPELKAIIEAATDPEVIRNAIVAEAEKQAAAAVVDEKAAADKAVADKAAADKAAADAAAAQTFESVETIGGKEFTFTASSQAELDHMIANAYKVAYAVHPTERVIEQVVDPVVAEKAAADKAAAEAAAKTELELKFKRGEITASDYIEQSGALAQYLEKQGVPLADLKKAVEANKGNDYEKSWQEASAEFVKTSAGADWPGGEKNLEILGLKIVALGLSEAKDKVAALAQAYADMKRTGMIFPTSTETTLTPEQQAAAKAAADKAIADKAAADAAAAAAGTDAATRAAQAAAAASAEAQRAAAAARVQSTSSSMFGASSGVGAGASAGAAAPASPAAKTIIPDNATPAEILQAWKEAQLAAGKNPNEVFMDQFRGSRA